MAVFRAFRGGGGYGGMPVAADPAVCPEAVAPVVMAAAEAAEFFSSLLGGIFGAAAGNWMYDSFFRGGGHGCRPWATWTRGK